MPRLLSASCAGKRLSRPPSGKAFAWRTSSATFAPPEEAEAVAAPRGVPAAAAADWPTGGAVASVCAGEKHYLVSLRPLLPGEKP